MSRMLRQERITRGWSIEYVAQKVGLTAEAIRLMENGERNPSYPILVKLEDLFQKSHRDLFGAGTPNKSTQYSKNSISDNLMQTMKKG